MSETPFLSTCLLHSHVDVTWKKKVKSKESKEGHVFLSEVMEMFQNWTDDDCTALQIHQRSLNHTLIPGELHSIQTKVLLIKGAIGKKLCRRNSVLCEGADIGAFAVHRSYETSSSSLILSGQMGWASYKTNRTARILQEFMLILIILRWLRQDKALTERRKAVGIYFACAWKEQVFSRVVRVYAQRIYGIFNNFGSRPWQKFKMGKIIIQQHIFI